MKIEIIVSEEDTQIEFQIVVDIPIEDGLGNDNTIFRTSPWCIVSTMVHSEEKEEAYIETINAIIERFKQIKKDMKRNFKYKIKK